MNKTSLLSLTYTYINSKDGLKFLISPKKIEVGLSDKISLKIRENERTNAHLNEIYSKQWTYRIEIHLCWFVNNKLHWKAHSIKYAMIAVVCVIKKKTNINVTSIKCSWKWENACYVFATVNSTMLRCIVQEYIHVDWVRLRCKSFESNSGSALRWQIHRYYVCAKRKPYKLSTEFQFRCAYCKQTHTTTNRLEVNNRIHFEMDLKFKMLLTQTLARILIDSIERLVLLATWTKHYTYIAYVLCKLTKLVWSVMPVLTLLSWALVSLSLSLIHNQCKTFSQVRETARRRYQRIHIALISYNDISKAT